MKTGQAIITKEIKNVPFNPKDGKHTVTAAVGTRMVFLFLGNVTPDSLPHYSADGALMALGYGPMAITRVQHGLVKALQAASAYVDHPDEEAKDELRTQIDEALTAADNFTKTAGPVVDPVYVDAERFRYAKACALDPEGPAAMLAHQIGDEMTAEDEVARAERGDTAEPPDRTPEQEEVRFLAIIDEARRRWGAIHG
jgi:hypothetical protein